MDANKKHVINWHGKSYYFLGQDAYGENYWLEQANWDCGWYWGGGYVETFTNNRNPEKSRDVSSHQHFDGLFFKGPEHGFDKFRKLFGYPAVTGGRTPYLDSEVWKICELMKAFYLARNYSDMIYCGGAHYTNNPVAEIIKNEAEYKRINNEVIPAIIEALYKIMTPEEV